MKKFKSDLFLWLFLFFIIGVDNSSFAAGKYISYIDFAFITAAVLVLKNRIYTAFVFIIIASVSKDMLTMPYIGFNLFSKTIAVISVKILCDNLYKENYVTQVFILAAGETVKSAVYALLVWIFYWKLRVYFIPPVFFVKMLMTAAAGAIIIQLMQLRSWKVKRWLRTIFAKR